MKEGLVSVIVPVYNSRLYLEKAVRSIMAQTYDRLEIILVNDGSKDESGEICEALAKEDGRIRVIHQKNQGPSAARNRGVNEADGEYLTFVDNDDLLEPEFVEKLYALAHQYDCDIALTKSYPFLEEEKIPKKDMNAECVFMDNRQLSEQLLDMGWTGLAVTMAKLFRKELFDGIRFHEGRIIADDDSTIYQLFWKAKKSVLFPTPLYNYRSKRKGSITHSNYSLSWLTGVEAFRERMEFYKERGEMVLYAKAMRSYCRKMAENYFLIQENLPNEKKVMRDLRKKINKQTWKMFFLKGNTMKQKCSALLLTLCPGVWKKVFKRLGK